MALNLNVRPSTVAFTGSLDVVADKTRFCMWLEDELDKVDSFYKLKEKEVYERFLILEDQFFHLKDHRSHL